MSLKVAAAGNKQPLSQVRWMFIISHVGLQTDAKIISLFCFNFFFFFKYSNKKANFQWEILIQRQYLLIILNDMQPFPSATTWRSHEDDSQDVS